MKAETLAQALDMEVLTPEMASWDVQLKGCYIGDLLSNVMGNAQSGQLWLTVMTNINVVAVAHLLELAGIVLLEGNRPDKDVPERAAMEGIPVFLSTDTAYDAAVRVYTSGLVKS